MIDSNSLVEYIETLGISIGEHDTRLIQNCFNDAVSEVLNNINDTSIPEGLEIDTLKLAASKYLFLRKTFNPTSFANMDLSNAIKQVTIGDVSTTFMDGSSDSDKLNYVINSLANSIRPLYAKYRRLVW